MTKIFFATDIHGSDVCWKKFINAGKFYESDVIILGGDISGKAIVPIIHNGNGSYRSILLEQETEMNTETEVLAMEKRIRSRGYYPYRTTPDEMDEIRSNPDKVHQIFLSLVLKTAEEWLSFADEKLAGSGIRCLVTTGNDDMFELDTLIQSARQVELAEGKIIPLDDHHEIISSGWSNPTPWHTFRETSEDDLAIRIDTMINQVKNTHNCVFNFHVLP